MIDRFRQVLSRSDHPSCMGGYVQEAVLREIDDFRDVVVYACGSTEMINNAHKLFTSAGLEPERFFSDAFVESRKEGFL
jgi:CDP-4-dehydro-6-deoxyglucose reductase